MGGEKKKIWRGHTHTLISSDQYQHSGSPANGAEAAGDISGGATGHSAEEAPHSAPLHWERGGGGGGECGEGLMRQTALEAKRAPAIGHGGCAPDTMSRWTEVMADAPHCCCRSRCVCAVLRCI